MSVKIMRPSTGRDGLTVMRLRGLRRELEDAISEAVMTFVNVTGVSVKVVEVKVPREKAVEVTVRLDL